MPIWEVNESYGDRRDGDVLRVSRSTDGRRAIWYHPDWRRRQAVIYQNASSMHEGDRPFLLPEWEDDQILINYYMFRMHGQCNTPQWTELITLAVQCGEKNDFHGIGSKIKAYTLADWNMEEVAEKVGIEPDIVEIYLSLYFDVRDILHNKERIASIVFPFGPELRNKLSPSEQREQLWLAVAFSGSTELLEFFTQNKFQMSTEEMEEKLQSIVSMFTAQAMEYGVYMRSEGLPRPAHFENFRDIQDIFNSFIGVKAQQEGIQQANKATEQLEKWTNLLTAVGIRRAKGREIQQDSLVTDLSISELRQGIAGGQAAEDDVRSRIINPKTGVVLQSFDEDD